MSVPTPPIVIADLNRTSRGIVSARYAGWLAKALGVGLIVRVPDREDHGAMRRLIIGDDAMRYGDPHSLHIVSRGADSLSPVLKGRQPILVTPASNIEGAQGHGLGDGVHLLFSYEEDGTRQVGATSPICLSFGNRPAAINAAALAIPIAKKLGVGLKACHTTYRNRTISGNDAVDHLAPGAHEIMASIQARATTARVEVAFHLAVNAGDVCDFVLQSAVDGDCGLIAMARGSAFLNGNADLVVRRSHIPVLVATS